MFFKAVKTKRQRTLKSINLYRMQGFIMRYSNWHLPLKVNIYQRLSGFAIQAVSPHLDFLIELGRLVVVPTAIQIFQCMVIILI